MVTKTNVIKSGGVMMAAMTTLRKPECFSFFSLLYYGSVIKRILTE